MRDVSTWKAALAMAGEIAEELRLPMLALAPAERETLGRALAVLEAIERIASVWRGEFRFVPVLSAAAEDATWAGERGFVTEKIPEKARTLLTTLLAQLRTLRVKAYTAGAFTPEHAETATGPQPWKYRLDADITLPGAADSTTTTLWFTDRLAGSTMLAGTADQGGVVFEVTQEMLDTIFALTYTEKHDPGLPAPAKDPAAPAAPEPAATPKPEPPKT